MRPQYGINDGETRRNVGVMCVICGENETAASLYVEWSVTGVQAGLAFNSVHSLLHGTDLVPSVNCAAVVG